jgi:hypothetical protein
MRFNGQTAILLKTVYVLLFCPQICLDTGSGHVKNIMKVKILPKDYHLDKARVAGGEACEF